MKPHFKPLATALAATLQIAAIAAVPLAWDVRPGQPAPVTFDRYHGETIEFSATFRGFGALPFADGADIRLWYQTNGMGSSWWSAPATIQSNVLSATWSPELDPGTDRVSLFFGAPSNAYAAAVLRLRHSPGFAPGAMPDPETFRESDPVFAAWLAGYTPPDTSLAPATNYTDAATNALAASVDDSLSPFSANPVQNKVITQWFGDMAGQVVGVRDGLAAAAQASTNYTDAATNALAASIGPADRLTDTTNTITAAREVYEVARDDTEWVIDHVSTGSGGGTLQPPYGSYVGIIWMDEEDGASYDGAGWYVYYQGGFDLYSADPDIDRIASVFQATVGEDAPQTQTFQFVATRRVAGKTYAVGRLALTNDLPDTAEIERDLADLRTETSLVYRLYSGSNVVAEVTNYNSAVHAPELRLMQLNESNEYITVWTETNGLSRTLKSAKEYTDGATGAVVNASAPRAWSKVTAGMGVEAPSNTTWLSTARTVIAGGLEYEKHLTSGGTIWLLESNGMTADFHPQTNNVAFLDLSNADGTPIFRVEKTDSFLVGVHIDDVTVDGDTLVCHVPVVASEHPLVRVRARLEEGDWSKEEDGTASGSSTVIPGLATITWTGTTGDWTCRIQNNTGGSTLFAQMEYLQEGGTKIVNSAPLDVSNGIICKDGIHKVRPVYTNGAITWEVVQ